MNFYKAKLVSNQQGLKLQKLNKKELFTKKMIPLGFSMGKETFNKMRQNLKSNLFEEYFFWKWFKIGILIYNGIKSKAIYKFL